MALSVINKSPTVLALLSALILIAVVGDGVTAETKKKKCPGCSKSSVEGDKGIKTHTSKNGSAGTNGSSAVGKTRSPGNATSNNASIGSGAGSKNGPASGPASVQNGSKQVGESISSHENFRSRYYNTDPDKARSLSASGNVKNSANDDPGRDGGKSQASVGNGRASPEKPTRKKHLETIYSSPNQMMPNMPAAASTFRAPPPPPPSSEMIRPPPPPPKSEMTTIRR